MMPRMNKLLLAKRVQILSLLCEGASMRSISRVCDVSINTVTKLLEQAGEACGRFHYNTVKGLKCERIQCDEIWSFCYAKQKNVEKAKAPTEQAGSVWTWTGLCSTSKMIVSYMVGDRSADSANIFMDDVAGRGDGRMQLTTDGHRAYLDAVAGAFSGREIDYAMLIKLYGEDEKDKGNDTERRYSPAQCTGTEVRIVTGNPNEAAISTSHVERHNLTMRMSMRRFTRLTNAFSKKIDNHIHALSLYFVFYNFCRIHKSLRVTPAMAAGLSDTVRDMEWIVGLVDAMQGPPKPRGRYIKDGTRRMRHGEHNSN
jgi:IS1 family transposase